MVLRVGSIALAAFALASGSAKASAPCAFGGEHRIWLDSALAAWAEVADRRLRLAPHPAPTIILFDRECRFERRPGARDWLSSRHRGTIATPDGATLPPQVTSFASHDDKTDTTFFVMALPSVWKAANIPIAREGNGLVGVFLHEYSHTRQTKPLGPKFTQAARLKAAPPDMNDDSIQKHFQAVDPTYAAVVEKEITLLYRAAAEPDPDQARKLAAEALALMEARQKRWFSGGDAFWKPYDDLFLTMEGFGQWVAYAWLSDPGGGALDKEEARRKMGSSRWWSQNQGLALFLVIDRLVPDWPERAFASDSALGIDLLRLAVAPGNKR